MPQRHPNGRPDICHEDRIIARIPPGRFPGLKERLRKAAKTVHVNQSVLILAAVEAVCDEIEERGKVSLPIKVSAVALMFSLCDFINEAQAAFP